MWFLKRFNRKSIANEPVSYTDQLTLYDQYGAMAYGIIIQIVPQPAIAQTVLIDLFTSTQVKLVRESPTNTACAIVRMARMKALEAKSAQSSVSISAEPQSGSTDNLPKLIFDLSFIRGINPEALAERLEMTYWDVLKALREHVKFMRTH
ncbi:hypothetical protein [Spirosoma arcticum]